MIAVTPSFPRILFVTLIKAKEKDSVNLLFRTQFAGWPKECMAQIYSSDPAGSGEFFGRYYRMQAQDRWCGRFFRFLRSGVSSMVAMESMAAPSHPSGRLRRWLKVAKAKVGNLMVESGIWEIIFYPRVSTQMEQFVRDFRPDIIYWSGYLLTFVALPDEISRRFGVSLCFQTLEDWPAYKYRWSPAGFLLRRLSRRLIVRSAIRLAFGDKMKALYEKRYRVPFQTTYHIDDPARFAQQTSKNSSAVKRIIYSGSLVLNRHESIGDMTRAMAILAGQGIETELLVYCSGIPPEVDEEVRSNPRVKFLPMPSHSELGRVLAQGDVLYLPEAFSVGEDRLGLAISTKCHLYMMARRPILVYGPSYAGTVEYAMRRNWARVVTRRDPQLLSKHLHALLSGGTDVGELVQVAMACFHENHDISQNSERIRSLLCSAIKARDVASVQAATGAYADSSNHTERRFA